MTGKEAISLFELNNRIRGVIESGIPEPVWIIAEISDLTYNRNGHCYMELIEKAPDEDQILARSRATIWATTLRMLRPYFETTTGQELAPGIKILIRVSVEFHELYSISLTVKDIEPSFTLGDLARKRQQIIRRLEEAGVFDMNKGTELALVPQRIAVISSPTAAGYGDFQDQLQNNASGYVFYTRLFPAVMQGEETASSIISALDRIARYADFFDVVAIIRGGGSKLDLSSFDHYDLGYYVTQFPLPVITGIGHEQDDSVLDLVAHTRCKTPTAVAEFLLDHVEEFNGRVDSLAGDTVETARQYLQVQREKVTLALRTLKLSSRNFREQNLLRISQLITRFQTGNIAFFRSQEQKIKLLEQVSVLNDPRRLLIRGYTLTIKEGRIVKSVTQLKQGDRVTTKFSDGEVQADINTITNL
ncbi:MAG: exodeoxyribonuclease VII large subunit [Bacteroidetes bacterium GWF2_49_14]|nr:MAG: exodeoxyribonuclease VII large subunit [Bacteroidetes bacterium GWF2_49_14]HBB92177.1 exodeoxyribonuclease VII large subunit [Bacteroidales bacterium]